ncbi:MAG: carboxypeptidase-like regulatory domain-containing protein [Methanomicrobiaceae archaeon]|nr:carboxypeptidase-like regulatory domain-containing protein [Methanomicrobiaceae archaeon]
MNRKNLYGMIVVVAAFVIVIGLWLSGAGQTGSLSGDVAIPTAGPTPPTPVRTFLTLGVTVLQEKEDGMMERAIQFSGTLTSFDGAPVPGQTVTIMKNANPPYSVKTATTGTNGAFSVMYGEYSPSAYFAVFAGDDQYQASQSSIINS